MKATGTTRTIKTSHFTQMLLCNLSAYYVHLMYFNFIKRTAIIGKCIFQTFSSKTVIIGQDDSNGNQDQILN